jgi:hypothetical protein
MEIFDLFIPIALLLVSAEARFDSFLTTPYSPRTLKTKCREIAAPSERNRTTCFKFLSFRGL